jgi:hypothetical protein
LPCLDRHFYLFQLEFFSTWEFLSLLFFGSYHHFHVQSWHEIVLPCCQSRTQKNIKCSAFLTWQHKRRYIIQSLERGLPMYGRPSLHNLRQGECTLKSGFDFLASAIFISQYHTKPLPSIALLHNRDPVWWVLHVCYDAK